jgi:hypothetical protein
MLRVQNVIQVCLAHRSLAWRNVFDAVLEIDKANQKFDELGPYSFPRFVKIDIKLFMEPFCFLPIPYARWTQLISNDFHLQLCIENSITERTFTVYLWNKNAEAGQH